jgi:hypothetical protein
MAEEALVAERFLSRGSARALVVGLAAIGSLASPDPMPAQAACQPDDVVVVDQAGFDRLRSEDRCVIRGPSGEVTRAAPCPSGNVDEQCVDAARQRLREAAAQRGANLVVVVRGSARQSYPPQYAATGVLYELSPRP